MIVPVKPFFALLMMLCMLVQTGWAQVHATAEKAHVVMHETIAPHSADGFHLDDAEPAGQDERHSVADHGGHCELSHLTVAIGAPVGLPDLSAHDAPVARPSFAAPTLALLISPDIERPKWALATFAVASR